MGAISVWFREELPLLADSRDNLITAVEPKMSPVSNLTFALALALAGCAIDRLPALVTPGASASDVEARMGKPVAQGVLPNGEKYWDYTLQPMGYHNYRVTFAPDERVQAVQDLLTNQNIARVEPGMSRAQVLDIVGQSRHFEQYANGTTSLSWRYEDYGV